MPRRIHLPKGKPDLLRMKCRGGPCWLPSCCRKDMLKAEPRGRRISSTKVTRWVERPCGATR